MCELMPAAAIAQITGKSFTTAQGHDAGNTRASGVYSCNYTGSNQLRLSVVTKGTKQGYDAKMQAMKTTADVQDVPGIGDAAFSSSSLLVRLEVLYGDIAIIVSGWTDLPLDQAKQIISQLHDKMPAK